MNNKISLQEHLVELKNRVIFCCIFLLFSFSVCYFFSTEIYQFLLKPLAESFGEQEGRRLIYTSPSEGFMTFTKVAFYASLFFSFPCFAIQFYLFLAPALFKKEKKLILSLLFFAPLLFLFGAALVYFFLLPLTLKFFLSFEIKGLADHSQIPIQLETKISEYLDLIINLIFSFGIAFQLPFLLLFLIRFGFLTSDDLRKKRKYWIVIIFVIAAILTPPDVLSQISLAIPMVLLFEIVILIGNKYKQ